VNRKIRDANFRRHVCEAYDDRCAVTGLRIINGGGRSEVQAAHIWGVGEGGPDVVQNGIALSGTIHWLFDRHLISLTDEYRLLVSHNKVPSELRVLFERQLDRIHLPKDKRLWPHPTYIERHRERFMAA
jgi:putative restriction endonuclease